MDELDPDILTDKMGHEELEPKPHIDIHTVKTLASVNERMSEETLDDCHAFTDLKDIIRQISKEGGGNAGSVGGVSSRSSDNSLSAGGSLVGDGGHLLETLEEFEEEEEGSSEGDDGVVNEADRTEHTGNVEKKKSRLGFLKRRKAGKK